VFAAVMIAALVVGFSVGLYAAWRNNYRYPPPTPPQTLCYHKVSRRFCWEGTWTTPRRFFAAIDRLRDRGYRFICEDDFLASLSSPHNDDDSRLFLTFDDGYAEVHTEVFDGLVARSVPFHVFLVTDYVGRTNDWDLSLGRRPFRHASWDEVREMASAGVTFGSHSASHRDLTRASEAEVAEEVAGSKLAIEDVLGARIRTLSYPFGRFNDTVKVAAEAAGYEAAFSLYPTHPNEHVDRFALRRNGVYITDASWTVETKLRPNALFWFEEMKCRTINAVAALTPILKRR
jgi:peptidoglycan/xylan/chitin deacetylase (PgdA/CDA1 family)